MERRRLHHGFGFVAVNVVALELVRRVGRARPSDIAWEHREECHALHAL